MSVVSDAKYIIGTAAGLGVWLLSLLLGAPAFSIVGILLILVVCTQRLTHLQRNERKETRFLVALPLALSILAIGGSAVYYLGRVTALSLLIPIGLLITITFFVARTSSPTAPAPLATKHGWIGVWASVGLLAFVAFFSTLTHATTTLASRSPWTVVSPTLLIWLGIAAVAVFFLARATHLRLVLLGSIVLTFAVVSVALFVYPLGFGFDPLLHQATLDHIAINGTITPKPFYYIGQYALELLVMIPAGLNASALDPFVVPVLAALLIPSAAGAALWAMTRRGTPTGLAMLSAALIVPLSSFINTTPQGLANIWTVTCLFLALPLLTNGVQLVPRWTLALLALAAVLIHPLAGLPCLLFVIFVFIHTSPMEPWGRRLVSVGIGIGGALMLPVAFMMQSGQFPTRWEWPNLWSLLPPTFFSTRYQALPDLLTWLGVNQWLWLLGLAAIGAWFLRPFSRTAWHLYAWIGGLLLINALLLSASGDFSFLIDYEQTSYVDRVVALSLFALVPLGVAGFALGMERWLSLKRPIVVWGMATLTALGVCAVAYTAYPRHDAYAQSRGFTTAQSDHETVASIASDAQDSPYVVLANQAVSAAAIQDRGFAPYYGPLQNVFYYPVPTGGPLYQIFLEMIEGHPTRQTAERAQDVTGVNRVYFVVNRYWWSADRAIEEAKLSADTWFAVNDGETWVFVYLLAD